MAEVVPLSQWGLSGYQFRSLLGKGGMGSVYLAEDETLKRHVAVKVISEQIPRGSQAYARFLREAQMMATVEHPHVVRVYSFGEINDRAYFIMEYVQGESLSKMIQKRGRLNLEESLLFLQQIVEALEAAWEKQVIHRDIKPSNILIDLRFQVRVADFGLAKPIETSKDSSLTLSGQIIGTPAYISPEQILGEEIDFRSDIYSLGIVFYEMLIGQRPFEAPTPMGVVAKQLNEQLPSIRTKRSELPQSITNLLQWMTQKNPAKRPTSYSQLLQRIRTVIQDPSSTFECSAELISPTSTRFDLHSKVIIAEKKGLSLKNSKAALILTLIAGVILGIAILPLADRLRNIPKTEEPIAFRYLTYSGQDKEPSASVDGRFITFISYRAKGIPRIWLKEISSGAEVPLTAGADRYPRFSPNGTFILYTHQSPTGPSLYRVSVLGGEPREIIPNGQNADWSPDGKKITFLRNKNENNNVVSTLMIASSDGNNVREISSAKNTEYSFPRWSPDGQLIAVRESHEYGNRGTSIQIFKLDGTLHRTVRPIQNGDISSVFWSGVEGDFGYILFDEPVDLLLSTGRLVLENKSGHRQEQTLALFNATLAPDVVDKRLMVFEESLQSQNLKEFNLAKNTDGKWLTRGRSEDRQPVFAPDGESILFTSSRTGNLDIWKIFRKTGSLVRITEDDVQDYDPAFSPDGKNVLWSSARSGHFEIWMADKNGMSPKQVTNDRKDAEHPTMTVDREWIIYTSYNLDHPGLWKIHPDGTGATRLIAGHIDLPEVSPDGKYALYRTQMNNRQHVKVVKVEDGSVVPFELVLDGQFRSGRARWLPNGKTIAFVGSDENGILGIFEQEFIPDKNTSSTRHKLVGFDPNIITESFAISPDGNTIVISFLEFAANLVLAEKVPNVLPRFKRITN